MTIQGLRTEIGNGQETTQRLQDASCCVQDGIRSDWIATRNGPNAV
jgi:hypothetical protein